MKRLWIAGVVLVLAVVRSGAAEGEIGFSERFALAEDREAALKELLPGSEEYYYFTCLHHQNEGKLDAVEPLLKLWRKRHGETGYNREIEARQMLLTYGTDPARTMAYLRRVLGLSFNHQREKLAAEVKHPTALDLALLERERLIAEALKQRNGLSGIGDAGLELLVGRKLTEEQRSDLLKRLPRPDVDGLVDVIEEELRWKNSSGFGSFLYPKSPLLKSIGLFLIDINDECCYFN